MRARQFLKPQPRQIDEIKMAPGTLRKFAETHPIADQITAGFELELCFKKIGIGSDYGLEDERVSYSMSMEDLQEMFREFVSPNDRGWARMENDYMESWDEKIYEQLSDSDVVQRAQERASEEISREELETRAKELAAKSDDTDVDPEDFLEQAEEELVDETWEDYRDEAEEEIVEEIRENLEYSFGDWLERNFNWLSSVAYEYGLDVPFREDGDGEPFNVDEMDDAADKLREVTGLNVRVSTDYHGARRSPGQIIIEPDGSISPDNADDAAAEVVTPPLPLKDALAVYRRTVLWAKEYGGYTNNSTGLHFNISSPDMSQFDYLKMALLLGDQYLLQQFERQYNSYCRSALEKITRELEQREPSLGTQPPATDVTKAQKILDALRAHTYDLAKVIAEKAMTSWRPDDQQWATEKYISLNWKGNYMEVRSAGGPRIMEDPGSAIDAIYRVVRVWASAVDPSLDREEYLKKLYKMTQGITSKDIPANKSITISQIITKYMTGDAEDVDSLVRIYRQELEKSRQRRQSDKLVGVPQSKLPQPSPQMNLDLK